MQRASRGYIDLQRSMVAGDARGASDTEEVFLGGCFFPQRGRKPSTNSVSFRGLIRDLQRLDKSVGRPLTGPQSEDWQFPFLIATHENRCDRRNWTNFSVFGAQEVLKKEHDAQRLCFVIPSSSR